MHSCTQDGGYLCIKSYSRMPRIGWNSFETSSEIQGRFKNSSTGIYISELSQDKPTYKYHNTQYTDTKLSWLISLRFFSKFVFFSSLPDHTESKISVKVMSEVFNQICCCTECFWDMMGMNCCFFVFFWRGVMATVFNANFNNISVISWRSVLLVEETRVSVENHRPAASHWETLSHNVVIEHTSPWAGFELAT